MVGRRPGGKVKRRGAGRGAVAPRPAPTRQAPSAKGRAQLVALGGFLGVYFLLKPIMVLVVPLDQLTPRSSAPPPTTYGEAWQLLIYSVVWDVPVLSVAGLLGLWVAKRMGLPGVFREGAGWRRWVVWPTILGLVVGESMLVLDLLLGVAPVRSDFPLLGFSLLQGPIGEEILFRMGVVGLCAFPLHLILRRWGATWLALWAGNLLGALAFACAHIDTTMRAQGLASASDLSHRSLIGVFLLNGLLGLVAGERYLRDGLVAAVIVHFWAAVVGLRVWLTGP